MKLSSYLKDTKAERISVTVDGVEIDDVYMRRLSAGEGLTLKEAFSGLVKGAGDLIQLGEEEDVAKVDEKVKRQMTPEQLKCMFAFQKLFAFLHLSNKEGQRMYDDEKEFDKEVPDEFVQAFYTAASDRKKDKASPEKNSETPQS